MKIVSFDEFIKMPSGTVFAPWKPSTFCGEVEIKVDAGEECNGTYFGWSFNGVCPILPIFDNFEHAVYDGATVDYMDYKQFAVFEESDIDNIIKVLQWAKNGCNGNCDVRGLEE